MAYDDFSSLIKNKLIKFSLFLLSICIFDWFIILIFLFIKRLPYLGDYLDCPLLGFHPALLCFSQLTSYFCSRMLAVLTLGFI